MTIHAAKANLSNFIEAGLGRKEIASTYGRKPVVPSAPATRGTFRIGLPDGK